jgi:hypothetical protein
VALERREQRLLPLGVLVQDDEVGEAINHEVHDDHDEH